MVGQHHQLNVHEFEQTLGDGEGQGSLACFSPWSNKELDTTQQLKNNNKSFNVNIKKTISLNSNKNVINERVEKKSASQGNNLVYI